MDQPPAPPTRPRRDPAATLVPERWTLGKAGTGLTVLTGMAVAVMLLLTWAGRADLAPPAWLIVPVTVLPYLYAGLMVWGFALWSVAPDRWGPPLQLVVLLVVAGALWGPSWAARPDEASAGEPVTVMTWNLRRLWGGPDDGGDPLACAIRVIETEAPDVVALQEVSAEDVDALTAALGLSCTHATYLAGGGRTKGGLAACTRGDNWTLNRGGGQRFVDPDDWHYAFAEFTREGAVFNLLAVHLHPYELSMGKWIDLSRRGEAVQRAQSDQSAALLARMGRLEDPTLVAGDFNSTRDAALHVGLRKTLTDTWERGGLGFGGTVRLGGWAPLRVDYSYASSEFAVLDSTVIEAGCSDHRPVVSDLVLRP